MKRFNWIRTLLLTVVIMSACFAIVGCGNPEADTAIMGDQEQFLKDMAEGIEKRLSESDTDTSSMTREEQIAHYEKLVNYELNQIQKYESQTFEDEEFDELAHLYIYSCMMQLEATDNYKNTELYDALWEAGRIARNGLIITFYDRYDLPITSEQADKYRTTTNVEYSISGDTDFLEFFGSGKDDVVLDVGELMIVDAEIALETGYSSEFDRYEYSYIVKNNSEYGLESFSLDCVITDLEGNILGSDTLWIHNHVGSGKTAVLSGAIYLTDYRLPFCIVPDKYTYDGNGDSIVYELDAEQENAEQYTIKIEVKGNNTSSGFESSSGMICIECGEEAYKSYSNPFSGELEYYCNTHYQEILNIIDMMMSDVSSSDQSQYTCEECSKEGTHTYESFTGQTEHYCTEHYKELMNMLESLGIG